MAKSRLGQGTGQITVDPRNPPRARGPKPPRGPRPVAVLGQGRGSITVPSGTRSGTYSGSNAPRRPGDPRDTLDGPPVAKPPNNPLAGLDPGLNAAINHPPRPFDPTEETQLGLNSRNLTQTEAYLDEERNQTIKDYGLDDPTDPFSRARALQLAWQQRDQGNLNSYASRGQLYAGSYQNAMNDSARGYLGDYDSLRKSQNDVLARIERKRMLARSGRDQSDQEAHSAALDRAAATPVDPTTVPERAKKPKKPTKPPKGGGGSSLGRVTQRGHRGNQTFRGGQGFGEITVNPGGKKSKGKRRRGRTQTISGQFGGAQGSTK